MTKYYEKLKNNRTVRKVFYFADGTVRNKQLSAEAEKTIEQISAESSFEADGMSTKSIAKDMVDMYKKSGFTFKEYILYDFAHLSMTERMKYVADWEHLGYTGTLNNYGNISLFDDKWCTYQKYRKFYNREMILSTDDENAVIAFIEHNPSFCCKPYNSSAGRGVKIVDSGEANDKINLFRELQKEYSGKFILEQLIEQHEDIKKVTSVFFKYNANHNYQNG